jgi:L-tryptophan--pyruvate aminotransferase
MIDLSVGNPDFLIPYWEKLKPNDLVVPQHSFMPYHKGRAIPELHQAICHLHTDIGNAVVKDREIVVGHGATQVLIAAMWVWWDLYESCNFFIKPPYWFRLDKMAEMVSPDFGFTTMLDGEYTEEVKKLDYAGEVVISPNNPDNSIRKHELAWPIYDLCYNWPQYTEPVKQNEDIMIFSLAKATGHAGTRIGWAIVKDPNVAEKMRYYIEMTTGGVSVEAQLRAERVITDSTWWTEGQSVFAYGKLVLSNRWQTFRKAVPDWLILNNNSGMFAWVSSDYFSGRTLESVFEDLGIKVMDGQKCGGGDLDARINLGCSEEEFSGLIQALEG